MAKKTVKGRSATGGKFTALPEYLLRSPAYVSMTPVQKVIYVDLRSVFNGFNNGALAYAVRSADPRCGISKNSVGPALKALEKRGFIEQVSAGAFSLKVRHAAEYRLTDLPCDVSGKKPTKAFMNWRPEI